VAFAYAELETGDIYRAFRELWIYFETLLNDIESQNGMTDTASARLKRLKERTSAGLLRVSRNDYNQGWDDLHHVRRVANAAKHDARSVSNEFPETRRTARERFDRVVPFMKKLHRYAR